jgi:hypothetical protein
MNGSDKYKPPQADKSDAAHAVARSGLGAIPFVGTAAIEILSAIITPSLEKRRNNWMEEVGEALRKLETDMNVVLETLQENEAFIDTALEASQIALRTSNKEKREALRNAILNAALPDPPDESMQNMFLSFIDTLTTWHIKLLYLFNDPPGFFQKNKIQMSNISMGAPAHMVEAAYPDLRGRRDLYDLVWKDLFSRALVSSDSLHVMMTGSGVIAKRTTTIGEQFIKFIESPLEGEP